MAGIFNSAIFNDDIFNTAAVSAGEVKTGGGWGRPIRRGPGWRYYQDVAKERASELKRKELEALYRDLAVEARQDAEVAEELHDIVDNFTKASDVSKNVIPASGINWTRILRSPHTIRALVELQLEQEFTDEENAAELLLM